MHSVVLHDIGQESVQLEFILSDIKVMDFFQINKVLYLKLILGISMLNLPLMMLVQGVFLALTTWTQHTSFRIIFVHCNLDF